jgi:hypothetical protein
VRLRERDYISKIKGDVLVMGRDHFAGYIDGRVLFILICDET